MMLRQILRNPRWMTNPLPAFGQTAELESLMPQISVRCHSHHSRVVRPILRVRALIKLHSKIKKLKMYY